MGRYLSNFILTMLLDQWVEMELHEHEYEGCVWRIRFVEFLSQTNRVHKKQIICSAECHVVIIITNADENVSTYVQQEGSLYIHMY